MSTVQSQSVLQPGKDADEHTQTLQQNIAQTLTALTGGPVTSDQVMPSQDQDVASEELKQLMKNPQPKIDLRDLKSGVEGKPRTESSKHFLGTFLARLRKKHPEGEVVEKS